MAIGKNLGANSQSSNDFLEPLAPTGVTPSNVTGRPYNDGAVSVSFSLPANSPAATSYTVTSSTGETGTGASSPVTVTGLDSSSNPTFTVVAINAVGSSPASAASSSVTVTTVPATMSAPSVNSPAPSAGANAAGATYDTVSWTAPVNGGSSITLYRWTSSDGKTGTTTGLSVDVSQEGGTAQTYQVRAENADGSGVYSTASGSVTTFSFTPFSFVPFGAFGFSPFNAFSFSPFNAFGFTPFNFAPFGFAPFNFSPR